MVEKLDCITVSQPSHIIRHRLLTAPALFPLAELLGKLLTVLRIMTIKLLQHKNCLLALPGQKSFGT